MTIRTFVVAMVLSAISASAMAVGPRESLTFQNVGLYGGWNEYFVSEESPFDYLIVQAGVDDGHITWHGNRQGQDSRPWNEWLKRARACGKRVIADLSATVTDETGQPQAFRSLYNIERPLPLERFYEAFDLFFAQVDEEELYAVTLSEENVFWNGQDQRLKAAYAYLKDKYDIPVFQWYSPSASGAIAGLSWPNLPADGWALDEYFIQQPVVEQAMRMYAIMRKPSFQIIWAAPDMGSIPWSEKTFWDQYAVCRKYNIPIAFFNWSGPGDSPHSDTWAWDPKASSQMRDIFVNYCVYGARLARRLPPVSMEEWDFVPWAQKQIKLEAKEGAKNGQYKDEFVKAREIASWSDAQFTGFMHLKWDSSPLQLKPRIPGQVQATVRYSFDTVQRPARINVSVSGMTSGGNLEVLLKDMKDATVAQSVLADGIAEISYDAAGRADTQYVVIVHMNGDASEPNQTLAEYSKISVECEWLSESIEISR